MKNKKTHYAGTKMKKKITGRKMKKKKSAGQIYLRLTEKIVALVADPGHNSMGQFMFKKIQINNN